MYLKVFCKLPFERGSMLFQTFLAMQLSALFIFMACLQVSANGYAQKISISEKNASIQKIFKEIEKQSEYEFFYNERLLQGARKVNIKLVNASLEEVLGACFKDQPLTFAIVQNT